MKFLQEFDKNIWLTQGSVVRSSFYYDKLAEQMGLQVHEHITLVQAVGLAALYYFI